MFIAFDYKCTDCDTADSRFVEKHAMDAQLCHDCKHPMVKLPAGTRTTFRFADRKLK